MIDVALDVIPVIISSAALMVAVISARRQWRSARNANAVSAVLKLFEEYRADELRLARRVVFRMKDFPAGNAPALGNLPDDLRVPCERVAHYFDHVGLLVGYRLVPAKPMISFFGFGCAVLWRKLEPCIIAERELRKVGYYLGYFEGFAVLSEKSGADEMNRDVAIHMRSGRMRLE
ncbi:hypothetical protein [Micromonospora wenchangensis]|uniref:hypothetical protein n=1 Tax=Micromonospora wenchangensis TaxID=1185415 RepID=UPI003D726D19